MIVNKKIIAPISLSLSLLLITPSVLSAAKLDDFVMSTSTSAGSWTDPLGGGKYLYGGDFKLKVKSTASVAPFFQFKEPGVKIGCSGISIEGGFLSYLGLDKLQDMLSNAGSSLVMGIILGMEFTLPAISSVFAKIRAWANALQALLQNTCNFGKLLGKGFSAKAHTKGLSDVIEGPFNVMDDWMSGGKGFLEDLEKLANCSGDPEDPNCKLGNSIKEAMGIKIEEDAKASPSSSAASTSITGSIVLEKIGPSMKTIALSTDLKEIYGDSNFDCGVTATPLSPEEKLFDALKFTFFGEMGASEETIQHYEHFIDKDKCDFDYATLSAPAQKAATTQGEGPFSHFKFGKIEPLITDPKDAAQFLVFGTEKIVDRYNSVSGNSIKIPNRKILYMDIIAGETEDKKPIKKIINVYLSSKTKDDSAFELQWSGIFKESLKAIRESVSSISKQNNTSVAYMGYDTSSVSTVSAPLLLPNIKKYVQVIANLELRAKKVTPQTEMLKVNLAKINSILYSKELIGAMESRVLSLLDGTDGDASALIEMSKNIKLISSEIRKVLKELENEVGDSNIVEQFEKLEREQKLESIKTGR